MAVEHHFYMDTAATCHELRDIVVQANVGFEARPDLDQLSRALSNATNVTLLVHDGNEWAGQPDNGVLPTRSVTFRDRKLHTSKPDAEDDFEKRSLQGILALLKAYPAADAYWEAYDARAPMLLRRNGRLVLSQAQAAPGGAWDDGRQPYRAMIDLPYTVEPLGPWDYRPVTPSLATASA